MVFTDKIHLVAGNLQQLHAFAEEIGLKKTYFQGTRKGHPHYDLTNERIRKKAIQNGALVVNKQVVLQVAQSSVNNNSWRRRLRDIWTMNDIILIDSVYYTSDKNYSIGIGCCSECGLFVDIGVRWCKKCDHEALILKSNKLKDV